MDTYAILLPNAAPIGGFPTEDAAEGYAKDHLADGTLFRVAPQRLPEQSRCGIHGTWTITGRCTACDGTYQTELLHAIETGTLDAQLAAIEQAMALGNRLAETDPEAARTWRARYTTMAAVYLPA